MNAARILAQLNAAGVNVTRRGDNLLAEPKAAVTDSLLTLMRAHKGELLAALSDQAPNVPHAAPTIAPAERGPRGAGVIPEAEARRRRVLDMLAERPGIRYAILTDTKADAEAVLLTLAIRGQATCEFHIPRDRYDPFLLFNLIERDTVTVH